MTHKLVRLISYIIYGEGEVLSMCRQVVAGGHRTALAHGNWVNPRVHHCYFNGMNRQEPEISEVLIPD